MNNHQIKVMIVDASRLFQQVIAKGLISDSGIGIAAAATYLYDARDKILLHRPDVLICEINRPNLDGMAVARQLPSQRGLPVILIGQSDAGAAAAVAELGATAFIPKPDINSPEEVKLFILRLIRNIRLVAAPLPGRDTVWSNRSHSRFRPRKDVIAIGASTGGTEAIDVLLQSLQSSHLPGIVIVQHIPAMFSRMFAERLDQTLLLSVREAVDGDEVKPGTVLLAPGEQHMELVRTLYGYKVRCFEGSKVNGHCPSVDVLFHSVAKAAGERSVGVLLTGMGMDGAGGLLAMRQRGASTLAQDEASSVVYGMPKAAFERGAVQQQVSLSRMGQTLMSHL
ncbi:chemotaxis-specific protein-glutamate methyltransferase CheB [Paenibacillus sp. GCM10012307]|uniref:protein-glutamate methylesterase n=1 Tax=Paenibacillus roseus TaxID=2798579 RepID=A0A934J3S9_9BACL|nr:chemotaxis-specific protein-glutamate methyltransferase CheB [Paenibacillus roseus]